MSHKPMYKANEDGFDKVRKEAVFSDTVVCAVSSFDVYVHSR